MDDLFQVISALFLFGLVLVVAWWTTRLVGFSMNPRGRGRLIRVLENTPAGRDRSIMLIEVGGRVYLVGSAADQISLLDAIEDPAVIRRLLDGAEPAPANPLESLVPGSFRDFLKRVQAGQGGAAAAGAQPEKQEAEAGPAPAEERLKEQIERLRRLQD